MKSTCALFSPAILKSSVGVRCSKDSWSWNLDFFALYFVILGYCFNQHYPLTARRERWDRRVANYHSLSFFVLHLPFVSTWKCRMEGRAPNSQQEQRQPISYVRDLPHLSHT